MSHARSDAEIVDTTHNTARFFVETRQISWVLLIGTLIWGVYSYFAMPQRKDPDIPIRRVAVLTPWPGAGAEKIERPVLITVGATVIALIPLAAHGGPLWEPLCYSQIGGLCVATFITLLLVPVLYSVMVLDLHWVKWSRDTL